MLGMRHQSDGAAITGDATTDSVTVTGSGAGTSGVGLAIEGSSTSTIGGSDPNAVIIIADTISIPQATFTGQDIFQIRPFSANGSMAIGTGAGGNLRIDDTVLGLLNGFDQVTFGDAATTGTIRTADLDFTSNTTNYAFQGARLFTDGIALNSAHNLTLNFSSQATQTGAITGNQLLLLGAGAQTLTHNANNFNLLAADVTGAVQYLDIHMPGMSGYEATRRLRRTYDASELPIVALTAAALATEQARALAVGMNDFVPKPIDIDQLRTVVSHWLRRGV